MKRERIRHFLSFTCITLFIILAFASDDGYDEDYEHPPCDPIEEKYWEMGYYTCNTIEFTQRQHEFSLTIRDKESGEPLEGIYVKVSYNYYCMDTVQCSGQCFGKLSFCNVSDWGAFALTTDANGQVSSPVGLSAYWDARDVQVVNFRIEDLTGKYSGKLTSKSFYYNSDIYSGTIYLLNNDLL